MLSTKRDPRDKVLVNIDPDANADLELHLAKQKAAEMGKPPAQRKKITKTAFLSDLIRRAVGGKSQPK